MRLASIAGLLLGGLVASRAQAHGERPTGIELVWATDEPAELPLVVTNRGLVFADSEEGTLRFRLRCGEAYQARTSDRPTVFRERTGELTIGTYHGVYRSSDRACTLQAGSGLPTEPIGRVVQAPAETAQMFVTKPAVEGATLFFSADHGRSWSERYRSPTNEFFDKLTPAPSAPERLYASGVRIDQAKMGVSYLCSRSLDRGETWQEHVHATKVIPLAVQARAPDVLFAYEALDRMETEFRILRSEDGCASFTPVLEPVRQPNAFTLTHDGSTAWVGAGYAGMGGLYRSRDDGQFEQLLADRVQTVTCLHHRQGRLWMCATMAPNETGVWVSDDLGSSFQKFLGFEQVTEPVACQPDAQAVCAGPWNDFARDVHTADAGAADSGTADRTPEMSILDAGSAADARPFPDESVHDSEVPLPESAPPSGCHAGVRRSSRHDESTAWFAGAWLLVAALRRQRRTEERLGSS